MHLLGCDCTLLKYFVIGDVVESWLVGQYRLLLLASGHGVEGPHFKFAFLRSFL